MKSHLWVLPVLLAMPGCAGEEFNSGGDGSGSGRLEIVLDRPTRSDLDPLLDPRAGALRVSIVKPGEEQPKSFDELPPPADDTIVIENAPFGTKDVIVEVVATADGRRVGFGAAVEQKLSSTAKVTVPVRKRLLYVADSGGGQSGNVPKALQALELAPTGDPEPAKALEIVEHLLGIEDAGGVYVTSDGLSLVATGKIPVGGSAVLKVIATADHAEQSSLNLPFETAELAPVGNGSRAVTAAADGPASVLLLDLVGPTAKELPLSGGSALRARAVTALAGGKTVAIAGDVQISNSWEPRLLLLDVEKAFGGTTGALVSITPGNMHVATGVRGTSDGKGVWLAGFRDADPDAGVLQLYDVASTTQQREIELGTTMGRASGIVIHPNGVHAYLWGDYQYPGQIEEGMLVVNLESGDVVLSDDQFGPTCAAAERGGRVIAGQSHFANDRAGELADITTPGVTPLGMTLPNFAGSYLQLAIPFGRGL